MNVEAHSAAPVPTDAMNSQPWRVDPSVARAREVAHADPVAEQADRAGEQHQHLVMGESDHGLVRHPVSPQYFTVAEPGSIRCGAIDEWRRELALCELTLKICRHS
jgi:hypothetical protein